MDRLKRCLTKGVNTGNLIATGRGKETRFTVNPYATKESERIWAKHGTPLDLDENDKRGAPRMRGVRVDVEAMLVDIIRSSGRPVTLEEVMMAWGNLRAKRDAPLACDLGRIIAANDKRARKAAKLKALENRK